MLSPDADYIVRNLENGTSRRASGRNLMVDGFDLPLNVGGGAIVEFKTAERQ